MTNYLLAGVFLMYLVLYIRKRMQKNGKDAAEQDNGDTQKA